MRGEAKVLIGVGAAVGIAYAISKQVEAATSCANIERGIFYYFTYIGERKPFKAALGNCYPVIYTIGVWNQSLGDWIQTSDPIHDKIEPGSLCRVRVEEPCILCGFEPLAQPPVVGLLV